MHSWFLSTVDLRLSLLATTLVIAGVVVLYRAWRQPKRNPLLLILGWGLLFISFWPWMLAIGADRGWAIATLLPGITGIFIIALCTPWRDWNNGESKKFTAGKFFPPANSLRDLWNRDNLQRFIILFLVVGVLSFCAATATALVLFAVLEGSIVNRTIFSVLLILILWPTLMVWSRAATGLIRPASYLTGISIIGLILSATIA